MSPAIQGLTFALILVACQQDPVSARSDITLYRTGADDGLDASGGYDGWGLFGEGGRRLCSVVPNFDLVPRADPDCPGCLIAWTVEYTDPPWSDCAGEWGADPRFSAMTALGIGELPAEFARDDPTDDQRSQGGWVRYSDDGFTQGAWTFHGWAYPFVSCGSSCDLGEDLIAVRGAMDWPL